MFWKTETVTEFERALLIRDGRIARVLGPGRHLLNANQARESLVRINGGLPLVDGQWARVMEREHPRLAEKHLDLVATGPFELALLSFDGSSALVIHANRRVHVWKGLREMTVIRIDLASAHDIDPVLYLSWGAQLGPSALKSEVANHEAGLVFVDGALKERVGPGRHLFWTVGRTVKVERVDLRARTLEVTAQEILTKDRVSVRLTLTAFVRVTDPETLVQATPDADAHIYRLIQLAAREAVGGRTLDTLLNERVEVDGEMTASVRERLGTVGVEVGEVRVKDVILPGEMRTILNQVVEAEKAAQANLIRRREETAATRSLLNTARLMEDNPTLMRLKELEALERVIAKVGNIDLRAGQGQGLDAVLSELVRLKAD